MSDPDALPPHERWLRDNLDALAAVKEGLAQAKAGEFVVGPEAGDANDECGCGEPPYEDGAQCPICRQIKIDELMAKPGGASLAELLGAMLPLPRYSEDDDDDE